MIAQISIEILVSMFVAISIVAVGYPAYVHASSASSSALSSVSAYVHMAGGYYWSISDACHCS